MSRAVYRTVNFALAVVQHRFEGEDEDRFVLVHEKANRGWWLPGGGVDEGQTFEEAAMREAEEEAGLSITLTGILRIENDIPGRFRVIYHARPAENPTTKQPKSVADHHSRGARWVTLHEMNQVRAGKADPDLFPRSTCKLRGGEPYHWFTYLSLKGPVYPLSTLRCIRIGNAPPPHNPDVDPPRATYPTTYALFFVGTNGEGEVLVTNLGSLPCTSPAPNQSIQEAAVDAAQELGGALAGVLRVQHRLHVDGVPENHHAELDVVYKLVRLESRPLPDGFMWKPPKEVPDAEEWVELAPQSLCLIGGEGDPPSGHFSKE